jgi:predicted XRE-type DNA-binding protein
MNFKTKFNINKKVADIMQETELTRPTVNKFLNGDLDQLSIKNLKKLCNSTGLVISIEQFQSSEGVVNDVASYLV